VIIRPCCPEKVIFVGFSGSFAGLDHGVGYLVSITTEKMNASIQIGIATRELPRHP
jgi:hypothetical protein